METEESPQQSSGEIDENRESTSGVNDTLKYVNGEVDGISPHHAVLTTLPLDMSAEAPSTGTSASVGKAGGITQNKPVANIQQKRDTHNEIERRRKCKINIGIIKLGDIIPSCINAKLSKNQILEHAANHILELREKCEKLLTSNASEMQAEEIKNLMKENEQLRSENRKFKDLMKALQIPPNGVANPTAYLKGKGKKKLPSLSDSGTNSGNAKVVVTNAPKVLTTNQNATILPMPNQIVTQVGSNQVVNQGATAAPGNAILVQNPNGGYFLVPTNKNVTIQGTQNIAPNQITVVASTAGQIVNSSNVTNKVQGALTTSTVGTTTTATTQAVSTPIASTAPQGGGTIQSPGMVQPIRYLVPMMPGSTNQTTTQTVMVMAKPNNQNVPIRIAPQQPIRIAGTQPQVILPAPPGGVPVSANQTDKTVKREKSSPPKLKNLCSSDAEGEGSKVIISGTTSQSTIAPAPVTIQANTTNQTVAPNQVVLQRPSGQPGGPVTMQVVPKPVTQQFMYLQGQNGQLIPVVIQNPNQTQNTTTTVIQQPPQQQQTGNPQNVVTIPINQSGQGMINNRPIVVVSQPGVVATATSTQGATTGVITSVNNSITTTSAMSPLTVLTSQSSTTPNAAADDILAKAAESIFSPNTLNDNSPTLNLNEMTDDSAATTQAGSISSIPPFPIKIAAASVATTTTQSGSIDALSPFPIKISRAQPGSPAVSSPIETDGKKQKKDKKKKKKKEKSKDKDKKKDKEKKKKHKAKKEKDKDKKKSSETEKPPADNTMIKELDRGMANSIDTLPDSTSGTAIITDTLLQEWIEKEAGLNNPDTEDSRDDTITNVTADEDKKPEVGMETDEALTQTSTNASSNYSAEALLAGSNDTPETTSSLVTSTATATTSTLSSSTTTSTSSGDTTTNNTSSSQFGLPFNFGSDILSNSMSVSGLPTYIEDDQPEDGKSSSNSGLNSLKALGSMRDSILSFGGSQGNQTQASQQQNEEAASNEETKPTDDKSSRSPSPVDSLPAMNSPAEQERDVSSPESTHGFTPSPEPPNMFGSTSGLLSDNLDSKENTSQDQDEEEAAPDAPSTEPSSFPASHNSSWISHHSRASHLASGLKKQKPPVSSSNIPIPVPVTTTSSSTLSPSPSTTENPVPTAANIPPGFYTLPWLGPPIPSSSSSSSKTTPTPQESSENSNSIQPEKPNSIQTPTYLPTQRSSSPSYAPNQQTTTSSYAPQRSTSPTYVPSSHRSPNSPPLYFPKLASVQSSSSTSSPLTIDTSLPPSIFSSSGSLNTPTNCSVITTAPQGTSVSTTSATSLKFKLRPPSKTKFSPSTIHRTLTSGITEEESPEKAEEQKSEPRPKEHKDGQHKLPMQIKPGPEIRPRDAPPGVISTTAQPVQLKTKSKRSKRKKELAAAKAAAAAALAAAKESADADRSDLEDIGKRELPKNLVDQFPWLADEEEERKAAEKAKGQSDRSASFSIQSITQQSSSKPTDMSNKAMPLGIPNLGSQTANKTMPLGIPNLGIQNKNLSQSNPPNSGRGFSQSSPPNSGSGTQFWNPSTAGSYSRGSESSTAVTTTKQPMLDSVAPSVPSKSRIEYMPRQSPTNFGSSSVSSSANMSQPNQTSPVTLPNFGGSSDDKEMSSPHSLTSPTPSNDNKQKTSSRGRKSRKPKQSAISDTMTSPLNSPPDSSNSSLFSDFSLNLTPNLLSNQGTDSRTGITQKQDSNQRQQMASQNSPPTQRVPSGSAALPTPPADNFLFSPTSNSSNGSATQSSVFPNTVTNNRSDNNTSSDGDDFMTLAQAEQSLEFLPSSSPDQSQNVDAIDLSSLPMFDTPASTPRGTPSNLQSSTQSSTQLQRQPQQNQVSERSSVERQSPYNQSPNQATNMRSGPPSQVSGRSSVDSQSPYNQSPNQPSSMMPGQPNQMYSMPNTAQQQVAVTSSHSMTNQTPASRSQAHNRFMPGNMPSPEMQQQHQGPKRPGSDNRFMPGNIPSPEMPHQGAKRSGGDNRFMPGNMPSPEMQQHQGAKRPGSDGIRSDNRFMPGNMPSPEMQQHQVSKRPGSDNRFMPGNIPSPEMHHHHGTKRPATDNPQTQPSSKRPAGIGNQHHNQPPMPLMHNQDTSRGGVLERAPPSAQTSHRVEPQSQTSHIHRVDQGMHRGQTPPTSASQQVPSPHSGLQVHSPHSGLQHNMYPGDRQQSSDMSCAPTYDLSQSVAHQRKRSVEMATSRQEVPKPPTYDLSQSVGAQRNRPVERHTSVSDSHRTPRYDLSQSAGAQRTRAAEQHHAQVSEQPRIPTYDLTQSTGEHRPRISEPLRMPSYDLSQSVGAQRTKVSEPQRMPTYDLTQSARTQRPKVTESQQIPTYDLTQSAVAQQQRPKASEPLRISSYDLTQAGTQQRPKASEPHRISSYDLQQQAAGTQQRPKASEPPRITSYDLTQAGGTHQQRQKASEPPRITSYDLTQGAGTQQRPKASDPPRMPTYDLTQSAATQRSKASEPQRAQRMPTYDLTQSAVSQRTKVSETQRMHGYDLSQSVVTQRNRSVERSTSGSEVQRTPMYDLSQTTGAQRAAAEHLQTARSRTQRMPTYDLSQSASTQRARSNERPSSASESQRIPTYDLTQSPHRDPVPPPKQRKRPQNNTEQYFSSSDNTSSLRHMDSSNIAQESNPWAGFPTQRMSSVHSTESSFLPNFSSTSQSLPSSISQTETVNSSSSATIVPSLSPSRRLRSDMPTYLPHHPPTHLPPILSSPPQASKGSIGREAEISTPFNPMFPPGHTRAGLGMNVAPNFPPVFHEHAHQAQFNVAKAQLGHPPFNFSNIFNEVAGPNTSHAETPSGIPVHAMHLHGNPGMSVEDSMAHMRGNVAGRHVHGHPQAFGNNMRIDSLLGQNVSADGRTFKVGVPPMGAPFHSFGPGMPF